MAAMTEADKGIFSFYVLLGGLGISHLDGTEESEATVHQKTIL